MKADDKLYFLDGVHPQHNSMPAYGWLEKGKTREIRSNSGRQRLNLNGALNLKDYEVVIREDESINAQSTLKLFEELEAKNPKAETIYCILDNARYYKAKIVKEYLKKLKDKISFSSFLLTQSQSDRAIMEVFSQENSISQTLLKPWGVQIGYHGFFQKPVFSQRRTGCSPDGKLCNYWKKLFANLICLSIFKMC